MKSLKKLIFMTTMLIFGVSCLSYNQLKAKETNSSNIAEKSTDNNINNETNNETSVTRDSNSDKVVNSYNDKSYSSTTIKSTSSNWKNNETVRWKVGDEVCLDYTTNWENAIKYAYGWEEKNLEEYGLSKTMVNRGIPYTHYYTGKLIKSGTFKLRKNRVKPTKTYSPEGTVTFIIDPIYIPTPQLTNKEVPYKGYEVSPTFVNNSGAETAGSYIDASSKTSAKDINKGQESYKIIFKLRYPEIYHWDNDSTADIVIEWWISEGVLDVPTFADSTDGNYVFTGYSIKPNITYDSTRIDVSGDTSKTAVGGEFVITFTCRTNYYFQSTNTGNTSTYQLKWNIVPQKMLGDGSGNGIDVELDSVLKRFTGSEQSVTVKAKNPNDEGKFRVVNENDLKGKVANTYNVIVKPRSNYCWSNGSTEQKTLSWTIEYNAVAIPSFKTDSSGQLLDDIVWSGNKVNWSNYLKDYESGKEYFNVSFESSGTALANEPTDVGDYIIKLNLKKPDIDHWSDNTNGEQIVPFSIITKVLNDPWLSKTSFDDTYDGAVHVPEIYGYSEVSNYVEVKYYSVSFNGTRTETNASSISNAGQYEIDLKIYDNLFDTKKVRWASDTASPATKRIVNLPFSISGDKHYVPEFSDSSDPFVKEFEYDAKNPNKVFGINDLGLSGYNSMYMEVTDMPTIRTVGTYYVYINIRKSYWTNHSWEDCQGVVTKDPTTGSPCKIKYTVKITPDKIVKPKLVKQNIMWTGNVVHPSYDENYNSNIMRITETTPAKEVHNGYTANVELLDKMNCVWVDSEGGTSLGTNDFTLTYNVVRHVLDIPQLDVVSYEYTGKQVSLKFKKNYEFNSGLMKIEGLENSIEVNDSVVIKISLSDPTHYSWNVTDSSEQHKVVEYCISIKKKRIVKPYVDPSNAQLVYTGAPLLPMVENFNSEYMEYSPIPNNVNASTNAYTATIALKKPESYCWAEDGTSTPHTISYNINKKTLKVPTIYNSGKTFDNTYFVPEFSNFDSNDMDIIEYEKQKKAGNYYVSVKLKDSNNTQWDNGSGSDTVQVSYSINKAALNKPVMKSSEVTFTGSYIDPGLEGFDKNLMAYRNTLTIYEPRNYSFGIYLLSEEEGSGTVGSSYWVNNVGTDANYSLTVVKKKIAKPTVIKTEFNYDGELHSPTLQPGTFLEQFMEYETAPLYSSSGNYEVRIKLKTPDYCTWLDNSVDDVVFEMNINKVEVDIPSLLKEEYEYTGEIVEPEISKFDSNYVDVTYPESIDPSSYKVVFSLKDRENTMWADGTSDDISFVYKIKSPTKSVQSSKNSTLSNNNTAGIVVGIIGGSTIVATGIVVLVGLLRKKKENKDIYF